MEKLINLNFNPKPPTILHLDLNSCFATIEQQANPLLRGKPIAVAAYTTPSGCIIAPSIEAKMLGIKVGMRVKDGRRIYPKLIVLPPDPDKYRSVHLALRRLLQDYTENLTPKSIDEFVLDLEGCPSLKLGPAAVAKEIKLRIKREIGDWLTVSIGIGPNRFLAKTASSLKKPDGLEEINCENYLDVYSRLRLTDLCGIKSNNLARLNNGGIYTVLEMFKSSVQSLRRAFHSVLGYHWYLRLHGFEIDDVLFARRSYGNSYALPDNRETVEQLTPILMKLCEKAGFRMRQAGYKAGGIHTGLLYRDGAYWHQGRNQPDLLFDSRDIYKAALAILIRSPYKKPVHTLAVSCFNLQKEKGQQLSLMENSEKKENLVSAIDRINERWGSFVLTPAQMVGTKDLMPDRVSFGGIRELTEAVLD